METESGKENIESIDKPIKRKRGRPKGSTNKTDPFVNRSNKQTEKPDKQIDPSIFANAFKSVISLLDDRLSKTNEKIALSITNDEKFAKSIKAECSLTAQEKICIYDSSLNLAKKYHFLNNFGDEILIAGIFVTYGYRQISTHNKLKELNSKLKNTSE